GGRSDAPPPRGGNRGPHPRPVPATQPSAPPSGQVLHACRIHEPSSHRPGDGVPPCPVRAASAIELPRRRAGTGNARGGRRLMAAPGVMRDISAGPAQDAPTAELRRPRRDEPYAPATNDKPLLLAHGGTLTVDRLGTVPYEPTWELQDELAQQRRERRIGDRLLLLEHFPVYTIGRGGDEANLLATPVRLRELGAEFLRVDRGGDITFHGPGQLVAYPIVELRDPLDLRRYVRSLEAAIIRTAAAFGVAAARVEGLTGVWVDGERKLAAIGVRVRRGVTTHGL